MSYDGHRQKVSAPAAILEVEHLTVHYETDEGVVEALTDVSLQLKRGETLGLVGETGAGKTTLALSVMGLLPTPPSHVISGQIFLEGQNLFELNNHEMREIRGGKISMIFQDPMTALNPVQKIGNQIAEVIKLHQKDLKGHEVTQEAMKMLRMVGIPEERYGDYPHEFAYV